MQAAPPKSSASSARMKLAAGASAATSTPAPAGPPVASVMLGQILVELGICDQAAIDAATRTRDEEAAGGASTRVRRLGEILVDAGAITQKQLVQALDVQAERRLAVRTYRAPAAHERLAGSARRNARVLSLVAIAAVLVAFGGRPALALVQSLRARSVLLDATASLEARGRSLERLARDPSPEASDAIAHVASHARAPLELRCAALGILAGGRGGENVRAALASTLGDESEGIRARIAWILGDRLDVRASLPALRERLQDDSPRVRVVVARALARAREIDGLGGTTGETRELLVAAADPSWAGRAPLAHLLGKSEEEVTRGVIASLETLSGFRIGGNLRLWRRWLELQPACDALLGGRRGPDVVKRIEGALSSSRMSAKLIASRALAHLGDARGAAFLARVQDRDETALRAALQSEKGIDATALEAEIGDLLSLLTGQEFGARAKLWRQWLDENDGGLPVVPTPSRKATSTGGS